MADTAKFTAEQKKEIGAILGTKANVLAGAHGQLYSSINNQFQFEKAASAPGPFVLIVDRNTSPAKMRLQLYDLAKKEVRFQTDLFQGMVIQKAYQKDAPNFYHFTTVGGAPQGISFSDESEGEALYNRVQSSIPKPSKPTHKKKPSLLQRIFSRGKEEKVDISQPTNFVHKSHIGFDPNKGFDLASVPDDWKQLFKQAGLKKKDLQNPETAALVYDTMRKEFENIPTAPPPPPDDDSAPSSSAAPPAAPPAPVAPPAPPAPPASDEPLSRTRAATTMIKKKSGANAAAASTRSRAVSSDAGANHLAAIRAGRANLKKVTVNKDDDKVMNLKRLDSNRRMSMMSSLKAVIAARRQVMSTQEESDDDASDSDWD